MGTTIFLSNISTLLGGAGTTILTPCIEKDPTTKKITFNKTKVGSGFKRLGISSLVTTATTTLHHCNEARTTRIAESYTDSLSEEEIYELEELLKSKEEEFIVNGVAYDLTKVEQLTPEQDIETPTDVKVFNKNL